MHLISTGKKTVLSDFADLETKSTYVHANGESTDFQFNAQRRVFVEVDRKAGLAVMRIKEKQEKVPEIQRVRKLTIDNAYCVGCAKQTLEEIAVGQSSGHVKLYNYRTAQLLHRFQGDRSPVLYVDYNSTDEYIAAVREGGEVNIYGTKTKTKIETLNFDQQSTLARFHPSKRFQLSVASYKGAVAVYDMQSKRKIFNINDAHAAPCRDLSMCSGQPSLLLSVGYDCKINIFDIRRKAQSTSSKLSYSHPLSTVALSDCGIYFCAGNLKGELIAYDMRSTKAPLAARNIHDCAVTRIAFVPMPMEEQKSSSSNSNSSSFCSANNVTVEAPKPHRSAGDDLRKSIAANLLNTQQQLENISSLGYGSRAMPRDSFCDFLDAQGQRAGGGGLDRMSTRLTQRRDSFDWETLHRKHSNEDQRTSLCQANLSSIDSVNSSVADSYESKASLQQTLSGPLRDRSNISGDAKLKQIAETDEQEQQSISNSSASSDKENPPAPADLDLKRRLRLLPASRNSTPHHGSTPPPPPQQLLPKTSSGLSSLDCFTGGDGNGAALADVRKELSDLREFVDERCGRMEQELKFAGENNKWQIFTQVANFWNQQLDNTQEIRDALALLLQTDRFMNEFSRLQLENDMLKDQLQQLLEEREEKEQN